MVSAMGAEQFKIIKDIIMKMQFFRMQAILANKLCGLVNLLQMPFIQGGFRPLYPFLKSKKLVGFLATYGTMCRTFAVNTGIDASSGLGYLQWIIMAIGLVFALIMGISTGFAFKNDAASAKAQLIGTIMIPVLFAIVQYIFNKTLGISLNVSSGL